MKPALGTWFGLFATTLAAGTAAMTIGYGLSFLEAKTASERDEIIRIRTQAAADAITRALGDKWERLQYVAEEFPSSTTERARGMIDTMVGDGHRVPWAGFASAGGVVAMSSEPTAEGRDVTERAWFASGMQGPFAGELRDARFLNTLLGGSTANPVRVVELAVPVGEISAPQGVLALIVRQDWLDDFVTELGESLKIDLFVLARDGSGLLSSGGDLALDSTLPSVRAAATGEAVSVRETWPDGEEYDVSVVPSMHWGDMPDFGWRILGRMDADAPMGRQVAGDSGLPWLGGLLAFALALSVLFQLIFVRPFGRLASFADELAEKGADGAPYPPHENTTRESTQLSAALSRLDRH
ncbi:MAG: hypothetical protein Q4F71_00835 [Paracoccus sp. (in: a-proteobacteria)]|nr:hypothetical protein [Paracoccus sp. (in: a-proteobacteria)]